jgi:hypothetical protein
MIFAEDPAGRIGEACGSKYSQSDDRTFLDVEDLWNMPKMWAAGHARGARSGTLKFGRRNVTRYTQPCSATPTFFFQKFMEKQLFALVEMGNCARAEQSGPNKPEPVRCVVHRGRRRGRGLT